MPIIPDKQAFGWDDPPATEEPSEPSTDKHEQRIEADPTWVLKAATVVIVLLVLWLIVELAR